ncbi:MAG: glycosyltransferase family 2 protein [Clostridiales bacterium]|nr:MAG: glycosyltransferase family 2 protein [Clostridiales bacterium]
MPKSISDKCIGSCLNQAEFAQNCELVVINDGSSDGTANILEKYKNDIKIINLDSGSVARVRNIGLDAAKGEYLTFLDADDWYERMR